MPTEAFKRVSADPGFYELPVDRQIGILSLYDSGFAELMQGLSDEEKASVMAARKTKFLATPKPTTSGPLESFQAGYSKGSTGAVHTLGNLASIFGNKQAASAAATEESLRNTVPVSEGFLNNAADYAGQFAAAAPKYVLAGMGGPLGLGALAAVDASDKGLGQAVASGAATTLGGMGLSKLAQFLGPIFSKVSKKDLAELAKKSTQWKASSSSPAPPKTASSADVLDALYGPNTIARTPGNITAEMLEALTGQAPTAVAPAAPVVSQFPAFSSTIPGAVGLTPHNLTLRKVPWPARSNYP